MTSHTAIEAIPSTISAMSATMTPFLYQTRTLTGLHRSRGPHTALRRICVPATRRALHVSIPRRQRERSGPTIARVPSIDPRYNDDVKRPVGQKWSVQRVETTPVHKGVTGNFTINRMTTATTESIPKYSDGVPFESAEVQDWAAQDGSKTPKEIEELTKVTREESMQRGTTITVAERHAFQRIFSDIFARTNRLPNFEPDGAIPAEPISPLNQQSIQEKLDNLFPPLPSSESNARSSREDKELAVGRYPPSLRPAAAKAMGLTDDPEFGEESNVGPDPLDPLRELERKRVEALMREAKTDFELWAILEKEVFSLVGKLGLQDTEEDIEIANQVAKKKTKRKGSKKGKNAKDAKPEIIEAEKQEKLDPEEEARILKEDEESKYQLALLGPLYPSYLLLALRLLDRAFAMPSALSLSILPKIKSLGPVSHVLGGSVAFYNELIRIYWYQHDNFHKVLQLLSEIEEAGLDHDHETLQIVTEICEMQKKVQTGGRGPTLKTLWRLPEFAPNKFDQWRTKIYNAISTRVIR